MPTTGNAGELAFVQEISTASLSRNYRSKSRDEISGLNWPARAARQALMHRRITLKRADFSNFFYFLLKEWAQTGLPAR